MYTCRKFHGGKTAPAQSLKAAGIVVTVQDANGRGNCSTVTLDANKGGDSDSPLTGGELT